MKKLEMTDVRHIVSFSKQTRFGMKCDLITALDIAETAGWVVRSGKTDPDDGEIRDCMYAHDTTHYPPELRMSFYNDEKYAVFYSSWYNHIPEESVHAISELENRTSVTFCNCTVDDFSELMVCSSIPFTRHKGSTDIYMMCSSASGQVITYSPSNRLLKVIS